MSRLTVSIVLYNEEKNMESCLQALSKEIDSVQENINVLLIDNNSTDASIKKLQGFLEKYKNTRLIKRKSNNLGEARQEALENTKTSHLVFLDADCLVQEGWLSALLKTIDDWSDDVGACGGVSLYEKERPWHFFAESLSQLFPWGRGKGEKKQVSHMPTNNLIIKTSLALEVGGFDSFFDRVGEDLDFSIRLNKKYKIIFSPNFQVHHKLPLKYNDWLRKMSFYGRAQSFVFLKNGGGLKLEKFFPLFFSILCSYFLLTFPIQSQVMTIIVMFIPRLRFFALSFLFYGFGELIGALIYPFKKAKVAHK